MVKNPLLLFNQNGIYCPQADIYIDPWRKVKKALITHAHADHSRWGNEQYMATKTSVPIMKHRLGDINIQGVDYRESLLINGVKFSFHPAGHIIGSAQIRVEYKGEIWVVSGDYKVENDGISEPFEPVKCHSFITECTFGLPCYNWKPQIETFKEMNQWWLNNQASQKTSVVVAYSLGKAQRIIQNIDTNIGPIYTHGAVENINQLFRNSGIAINDTIQSTKEIDKKAYKGSLIITPNSGTGSWLKKFMPYQLAFASGWMALRGARRRRAADRGFVISDHADWKGLLWAIENTGAENIITTHGYTEIFAQYLREKGYNAMSQFTEFTGESIDNDT
jgi:putative mRNA 3-end processing factor